MTASTLVLNAASGASADPGPDIDEIFSTHTYIGNGSTQDIVNGIDLANEGGMLWIAQRDVSYIPILTDSTMTRGQRLNPADNGALQDNAPNNIYALNNNGFSVRDIAQGSYGVNGSPGGSSQVGADAMYASWTFRKCPKFFDIVKYTGTGSNTAISHNLGSAPGMMWIKKHAAQNWAVYHRGSNGGSSPEDYYFRLNQDIAQVNDTNQFQSTAPTSTQFFLGTDSDTNQSGQTYVAYLFAHNNNDGGFGENGDQDVIKCGYYSGNGSSNGPSINLGFEPQWVLVKRYNTTGDWNMFDIERGFALGDNDHNHRINSSGLDQSSQNWIDPTSTGFKLTNSNGNVNGSGDGYLYVAIRKGPLNVPTDGTKVFKMTTYASNSNSNEHNAGFKLDFSINTQGYNTSNTTPKYIATRLTGEGSYLQAHNAQAEGTGNTEWFKFKTNHINLDTGWWGNSTTDVMSWNWRRAPSYFDVVAYVGTGSATTVSHNLGVAPEMIWIKDRGRSQNWAVYHANNTSEPATDYLRLNEDYATTDNNTYWNDTAPTSSVFTVGTDGDVNSNGENYIAYLFATADGVSKLGSWTGDGGSNQTIDCGFTNGARFVLMKKSDGADHWYLFDSVQGIVDGSADGYVMLNNQNAQVRSQNLIEPHNSGFIAKSWANGSGTNYIFYAIA